MNTPSIKTLASVFSEPKKAKKILSMSRAELVETEGGARRLAGCYGPPKTYDLRLHALDAIEPGLHGLESVETVGGEFVEYLNAGDTYAPTLIYWRGRYRAQSLGDFIERSRVSFK